MNSDVMETLKVSRGIGERTQSCKRKSGQMRVCRRNRSKNYQQSKRTPRAWNTTMLNVLGRRTHRGLRASFFPQDKLHIIIHIPKEMPKNAPERDKVPQLRLWRIPRNIELHLDHFKNGPNIGRIL